MFYSRPMRVFLIHGMARSPASMALLAARLRKAGHQTHLFGYFVTRETLEDIAGRLTRRVEKALASAGGPAAEPYAIVGHSLGNVIARLASPRLPAGLSRLIMIAPPNRPAVAARWLVDNAVFRVLTQDAGQKLADPEFYDRLPHPSVPTLVIAGTAGLKAPWLPFEGRPNDCVVALEETRLEGAATLEVEGIHTFLMNRRDVFEAVHGFLETGHLNAADAVAQTG